MLKKRYEILPLKHNDGRTVGEDEFNQTRQELVEAIDGVSFQPQPIHGLWIHDNQQYEILNASSFSPPS